MDGVSEKAKHRDGNDDDDYGDHENGDGGISLVKLKHFLSQLSQFFPALPIMYFPLSY